jgi:Leucine-rich repeat (LRR) protein
MPADLGWLTASHNLLESLPSTIGDLHTLESLDVSHNRLKLLPNTIGDLHKLDRINVGSNDLTELPDSMVDLSTLTLLNVSSNRLLSLPDAIAAELPGLCDIDASFNKLTTLPTTWDGKEACLCLKL